jgi:hypothetical protein
LVHVPIDGYVVRTPLLHVSGGGELQITPAHGSTQLPSPSQNPVALHAVFDGAFVKPHVPERHVRVRQIVSVPGQSAAATHWTQLPAPSQTVPPFELHAVPATEFAQPGVPPVHVAVAHVPHVGKLVASTAKPQTPETQTAVWHEPGAACGQSAGVVQPVPPPSQVHVQQVPFTQSWPEPQSLSFRHVRGGGLARESPGRASRAEAPNSPPTRMRSACPRVLLCAKEIAVRSSCPSSMRRVSHRPAPKIKARCCQGSRR